MAARPMKITTRTPPVRIAARHMVAIAGLPAEHAGYLIRWGMRHYADGHGMPVAEARAEARMDDRAWGVLIDTAGRLVDTKALAAGFVVVTPFDEARTELARVSASRIRAVRTVAAVANGGMRPVAATHRERAPAPVREPVQQRQAPAPPPEMGPWDQVAAALAARGATATEVEEAIATWRRNHVVQEVVEAIALLDGRHIARPVRYLDKILKNALAERREAMPNQVRLANPGPMMPKPVKRKIVTGPRAGWTFEGWTARGHQQGGATVDERREVWRNDSGTLSYKRPDETTTIPTYDEDPGLYETN